MSNPLEALLQAPYFDPNAECHCTGTSDCCAGLAAAANAAASSYYEARNLELHLRIRKELWNRHGTACNFPEPTEEELQNAADNAGALRGIFEQAANDYRNCCGPFAALRAMLEQDRIGATDPDVQSDLEGAEQELEDNSDIPPPLVMPAAITSQLLNPTT